MKPTILIVDDEPDARELLGLKLGEAGMAPVFAHDGPQAIALARETKPELIILDLGLPEMDGLEVCKTLQRDPLTHAIPIVMLTGRASEMDRIIGLELGASDYVTKPFSPRELALRIKNILMRGRRDEEYFTWLKAPGLEINVPLHTVLLDGKAAELTPIEFDLLVTLARFRGQVQSRARLLQNVFGYGDSAKSRTVDTHINRLQKKLGAAAHYIEAVRGVGYRFVSDN
jgi:DNA-binding response OmpR family regulator